MYFNNEPKFSLNGGFDLTIQKKNIPDRTLIYMNDVSESYNAEKKEKYFYLNNVILAQSYEIDDDGDHLNLGQDECSISVPHFENDQMTIEQTKACTVIRSDDGAEFFDFGYDNLKYPSQGVKKEIPNMFASTLFQNLKRNSSMVKLTLTNIMTNYYL